MARGRRIAEATFLGAFIGFACSLVPNAWVTVRRSAEFALIGSVVGPGLYVVGRNHAMRWLRRLTGCLTYV
jgi:hypothetical protein